MNTPGTRTAHFALLCLSLCAATICNAQDTSVGQARRTQLLQALRPICERFVGQIATQNDIQLALTARPIDTPAVCQCAASRISADPRLERLWPRSARDVQEPRESDEIKSYITARMIASNLECLARDLETSLQSAELPQ